jgi:hypothetical protein
MDKLILDLYVDLDKTLEELFELTGIKEEELLENIYCHKETLYSQNSYSLTGSYTKKQIDFLFKKINEDRHIFQAVNLDNPNFETILKSSRQELEKRDSYDSQCVIPVNYNNSWVLIYLFKNAKLIKVLDPTGIEKFSAIKEKIEKVIIDWKIEPFNIGKRSLNEILDTCPSEETGPYIVNKILNGENYGESYSTLRSKHFKCIIELNFWNSIYYHKPVINESMQRTLSNIPELYYQEIPGDGHCLFAAVGLYLGENQGFIRSKVSSNLEHNLDEFRGFIQLAEGQTLEDYFEAVRSGKEWASHVEIEILMRLLDRPILSIGPTGRLINPQDAERFKGEPIFVAYNGHNHYDCYLLRQGTSGREVLNKLLTQLEELSLIKVSTDPSVVSLKDIKTKVKNYTEQNSLSLLHLAVKYISIRLFKDILKKDISSEEINKPFPDEDSKFPGYFPIHAAIAINSEIIHWSNSGLLMIEDLWKHKNIDLNTIFPRINSSLDYLAGYSCLQTLIVGPIICPTFAARRYIGVNVLKSLIQNNAPYINQLSDYGTILHVLLNLYPRFETLEIIKVLLEKGADPTIMDGTLSSLKKAEINQFFDLVEVFKNSIKGKIKVSEFLEIPESPIPEEQTSGQLSSNLALSTLNDTNIIVNKSILDKLNEEIPEKLKQNFSAIKEKYIRFGIKRLLLHQLIVNYTLKFRLPIDQPRDDTNKNRDDKYFFRDKIRKLYKELLNDRSYREMLDDLYIESYKIPFDYNIAVNDELKYRIPVRQEVRAVVDETVKDFEHIEVQNKINFIIQLSVDKLVNHEIENKIENIISEKLLELENNYSQLKYKPTPSRVTWIITGGPASGKSSISKIIRELVGPNEYDNLCIINPDYYKRLLNLKDHLSYPLDQHADLVHQESSIISKKIIKKLEKQLTQKIGPDLLLDSVSPNDEKGIIASYDKGTCNLLIATCPIKIAIAREISRSVRTGRKVHRKILLEGHRKQSINTPDFVKKFSIFLKIYNTNVEQNSNLEEVVTGAGTLKELIIKDMHTMLDFVSKSSLNINSKSEDDLYLEKGKSTPELSLKSKLELIFKYVEAGLKLKFYKNETLYLLIDNKSAEIVDFNVFFKVINEHLNDLKDFIEFLAFDPKTDNHFLTLIVYTKPMQQKLLIVEQSKCIYCSGQKEHSEDPDALKVEEIAGLLEDYHKKSISPQLPLPTHVDSQTLNLPAFSNNSNTFFPSPLSSSPSTDKKIDKQVCHQAKGEEEDRGQKRGPEEAAEKLAKESGKVTKKFKPSDSAITPSLPSADLPQQVSQKQSQVDDEMDIDEEPSEASQKGSFSSSL